ncbi:MAG: hypothetical protein JXR72_07815, partial [Proteobacteria bacterium]|nr:hypothetical protein [Pseudomonadota bacterium]
MKAENAFAGNPRPVFSGLILIPIFLVSVTLVGLQLSLMRSLSVVRYHHFSYLVISTALLGFGISGTFLSFLYPRMKRRLAIWMIGFYALLAVSIPCSYLLAQSLPVDTWYLLFSTRQQLLMVLFNLLLIVPFFSGGVVVGAAISSFQEHAPAVYA